MKKNNLNAIFMFIFMTLALVLGSIIGFQIQMDITKHFTDYCDEKYGMNSWKIIEKTDRPIFFIGQMWECVKA